MMISGTVWRVAARIDRRVCQKEKAFLITALTEMLFRFSSQIFRHFVDDFFWACLEASIMVLEIVWERIDWLRMKKPLAKRIKLLQLSNFHLFFIKFVLSFELLFELFVRGKEFKVLKIIFNDRILRVEIDF